ncbi:SDR family NAD(P)-dependent oxidoreductase [Phenylobacterium sp.]|uniref:SDR family NAD(P)-dependent oxidoreductase n=1 Tax=Phenylobacterium sp. TaxID=1871053 RepID=UPI0025E2DF27|nr:SDR family NAD(P)-dependent oxidoreductase [Phenylobacterium sp.]
MTGAAGRVGRALARAAADAGFDVAIHVRSEGDDAEAAAGEVRGRGRKAVILPCDLRKESAVVALVGEAEAELGAITLLVNAAAAFEPDRFGDMNRATWDLHMETNLRAPLVLAQAFARRLPADRDGLIVNVVDAHPGEGFSHALSQAALERAGALLADRVGPRLTVRTLSAAEGAAPAARAFGALLAAALPGSGGHA